MSNELREEEFESLYDDFLNKLFYINERKKFHKIENENKTPFGIFRNESSIVVKALSGENSEITISYS